MSRRSIIQYAFKTAEICFSSFLNLRKNAGKTFEGYRRVSFFCKKNSLIFSYIKTDKHPHSIRFILEAKKHQFSSVLLSLLRRICNAIYQPYTPSLNFFFCIHRLTIIVLLLWLEIDDLQQQTSSTPYQLQKKFLIILPFVFYFFFLSHPLPRPLLLSSCLKRICSLSS